MYFQWSPRAISYGAFRSVKNGIIHMKAYSILQIFHMGFMVARRRPRVHFVHLRLLGLPEIKCYHEYFEFFELLWFVKICHN